MTTAAAQPVQMTANHISEAAGALARAFYDDPLMTWILPREQRRARPLTWFMTAASKYASKFGEPFTTAERVDGAALWLPPGDEKVTTGRMVRTGMLAAPLRMGFGPFMRFMKAMDVFEKLHERDAPERHWYLMVLGVDPPRQGQGVGGSLIAPILARADAEGLPCYLETLKTRNLGFYRKHGFEVVVEDDLPSGPHFWTMKRAPRA